MARGVKYRCEFYDRWNVYWKIDFLKNGWTGGHTHLLAKDPTPLLFPFDNNSDDFDDPIRQREAQITIVTLSQFFLDDLYEGEDLDIKVNIYYTDPNEDSSGGETLYFTGFIANDSFKEPYDVVPHEISLKAVCGLESLNDILYEETESGDFYEGIRFESQILLDILGKIEHTEFKEFVNIYETRMNTGVGDSPMDQLRIGVDQYQDQSCAYVLEQILSKYKAVIRQSNGIFNIFRPKEIKKNPTVYGRWFTGETTKTAITLSTVQYINRTLTNPTNRRQIPGGNRIKIGPAKKVTISFDYGNRDSWISNWQFKADTFHTPGSYTVDNWTKTDPSLNIQPISELVYGEKEGIVIYDTAGYGLQQAFGDHVLTSAGDLLIISFDCGFYCPTKDKAGSLEVYIRQGTKFLREVDDTTCEWALISSYPAGPYLKVTGSAGLKWTGWQTYQRQCVGFDSSEPLQVILFSAGTGWAYNCFKNIGFKVSSSQVTSKQMKRRFFERFVGHNPKYWFSHFTSKYYTVKTTEPIDNIVEHTYTKENDIKGKELTYDATLGDVLNITVPDDPADIHIENIIEQFQGALTLIQLDSLTQAAADFVTDHGADYPGITVGSFTNHINFNGTDHNDFSGATLITNLTGDLSGIVTILTTHITAVAQVDQVTKSGYPYGCNITCGGLTKALTWTTNAIISMQNFVASWAAAYAAIRIILTNGTAGQCLFTANVAGTPFTAASSNGLGDSYGNVIPNTVGRDRADSIALSGTYGTANITCDGVTKEVGVAEVVVPTKAWQERGESAVAPLLELMCQEIADQYARPKEMVTMILQEMAAEMSIDPIGCFVDDMNDIDSADNPRKFVMNRGSFDVRNRQWNIDLLEMI